MASTADVEVLLNSGLQYFPGAVCFWGDLRCEPQKVKAGFLGLSRQSWPVTLETIYDLASLTKILATTNLIMLAWQSGLVDLDAPLAEYFPQKKWPYKWQRLTIRNLLLHQSGLSAWQPFYLIPAPLAERRGMLLDEILNSEAKGVPGEKTIYSDLGFLLLGLVLENIYEEELDILFEQKIKKPLQLPRLAYNPLEHKAPLGKIVATEDGPRQGGPLDDWRSAVLEGVPIGCVHDDNCSWLGGVAGHAGLFGPAADIWRIMLEWQRALNGESALFQAQTLLKFVTPIASQKDQGRALGFDIKSPDGSLAGSNFSDSTVGHLGYTGTSLWWDYEKSFGWILLTNRVHPSAQNEGLKIFRPQMARLLAS